MLLDDYMVVVYLGVEVGLEGLWIFVEVVGIVGYDSVLVVVWWVWFWAGCVFGDIGRG